MTTTPTAAPSAANWFAATGWLTVGHAATVLFRLLGLVIVARSVGVEQLGTIAVGLAIASGLAMLFSGTQTAGIIEASRHPGDWQPTCSVAVRQQLSIAAVSYAAFAVVLLAADVDHSFTLLVFGVSAFTQAVTLRWLLVALGQSRFAGLVFAAGALVFLAGCWLVVGASLWRVATLHIGVEIAIAAVLWWRVAQLPSSTATRAPGGLDLRRTLRLSALQLARIAPITASVVVVAVVAGEVDAGRFGLPQRAALAAFALTALHTEAGTAPLVGRDGSTQRLAGTTAPILSITAILAALALFVADPLAEFVLDDPAYAGLGATGALLLLALGVAFLSGPRMQIGFAAGRDAPLLWASVGTALATIVLAAGLVAAFGLVGVGIAELAGQVAFLALVVWIGHR